MKLTLPVSDLGPGLARTFYLALQREAPRATERRLDEGDILAALRHHARAVQAHPTLRVTTRQHGGAVCNSYGARASADVLELETSPEGVTTATAFRGAAKSGPHGRATLRVTRVIRPGQTLGVVVREP